MGMVKNKGSTEGQGWLANDAICGFYERFVPTNILLKTSQLYDNHV